MMYFSLRELWHVTFMYYKCTHLSTWLHVPWYRGALQKTSGLNDSQKKDTQGIPPLKRKNGKGVAQSDLEKAEEFNGQFTDVFNKNELNRSRFWIALHLS